MRRLCAHGAQVKLLGAGAACLICLPAVALAGKKRLAGTQSLQIKAGLAPDRAKARGATLKFHIDYASTVPGKRINAPTKDIRLGLPDGFAFHHSAAGVCDVNKVTANGNPSICPPSSIVGTGTLTADARPLLPNPIPATITIYNARGQHDDLIFYVKTNIGVNTTYFFRIFGQDSDQDGDQDQVLDASFAPPSNGKTLYVLKTIDFSLHNSSTGKPFITNPPVCARSWPFSLTISTYGSEPTITAIDRAACAH